MPSYLQTLAFPSFPPTRRGWRWRLWLFAPWIMLLVAAMFADAQRGRCYASRAALVAQSPAVSHRDMDIVLNPRDVHPSFWDGWTDDDGSLSEDMVLHRERRAGEVFMPGYQSADIYFISIVPGVVTISRDGRYSAAEQRDMRYSDVVHRHSVVTLQDRVHVKQYENGRLKDSRTQVMSNLYVRLHSSTWYIVAGTTDIYNKEGGGSYADDLFLSAIVPVFGNVPDYLRGLKTAPITVYSTLQTTPDPAVGLDVWGLKRSMEDGRERFDLVKMFSNLTRLSTQSAHFSVGVYEIKVVNIGKIVTHVEGERVPEDKAYSKFKNTKSLIRPSRHSVPSRRFIEVKEGQPSMLLIDGHFMSPQPSLTVIPKVVDETSLFFPYPTMPFMVFNAFPMRPSQQVHVGFHYNRTGTDFNTWAKCNYSQMLVRQVEAVSGDPYMIGVFQGTTPIKQFSPDMLENVEIPFQYGFCALVVGQARSGAIDRHFLCVNDQGRNPDPRKVWILLHNGLANYSGSVEVIFKWCGPGPRHNFLLRSGAVAYKSYHMTGVWPGYHLVKVTGSDHILIKEDFDIVSSLVKEVCVKLSGTFPDAITLGVLHGDFFSSDDALTAPKITMYSSTGQLATVSMQYCRPYSPPPCPACNVTVTTAAGGTTSRSGAVSPRATHSPHIVTVLCCQLIAFALLAAAAASTV